jgi:hypothetical protein
MGDTPTVRQEIAHTIVGVALGGDDAGVVVRPYSAADRVLRWLGNLDPDCDPVLLAHHLCTSRAEIEAMRARVGELATTLALILDRFTERGHPGAEAFRSEWVSPGELDAWREVLAGG